MMCLRGEGRVRWVRIGRSTAYSKWCILASLGRRSRGGI